MYLKGSKYSYQNRKKRSNPFRILFLLGLLGATIYFSIVIMPETQPFFIPTATPTTPPESFINEALKLESEGRLSRAVEMYQRAIDSDPKNASNYIAISKLQMFTGMYADALKNAENAILIHSTNSVAHAIRGWALGKQRRFLDAETAFNRAVEIDPNNALAYAYRTEIYVDQINAGQDRLDTLDKATQDSRTAISLGPQLMETHRARGLILEITGNYEDAITEFQIAISINPNVSDLHLAIGRAYRAGDNAADAITSFERARSLNPYDPWAPYYISRTYSSTGEYAKAIQQAEDAIDLDPKETRFYWNLGTQYYRAGRYINALKYFKLSIEGGTSDDGTIIEGIPLSGAERIPELYYMYGILLARSGQCIDATKIVQMLTSGVPEDATAMINAQYMTDICKAGDFDISLAAPDAGTESTMETTVQEEDDL